MKQVRCFFCHDVETERKKNNYIEEKKSTCSITAPFSTLSAFKGFGICLAPALGLVKIVIFQQLFLNFYHKEFFFKFISMTFSITMFTSRNLLTI